MIKFTPEQEEFRKSVARFVDAEVVPVAAAIDERGVKRIPRGFIRCDDVRVHDVGSAMARGKHHHNHTACDP